MAKIETVDASLPKPAKRAKRKKTGGRGATKASRHIPNDVKRAVFERDGGRCTFADANGQRCGERGWMELHHTRPFAQGGDSTADNVALRCRTHNDLAARLDYGSEHIERSRRRTPR